VGRGLESRRVHPGIYSGTIKELNLDIRDITPTQITIGLGSHFQNKPDREQISDRVKREYVFLAGQILFGDIQESLPASEQDIIRLSEDPDKTEKYLEDLDEKYKLSFLENLSRIVVNVAKAEARKAVMAYLEKIDVPEMAEALKEISGDIKEKVELEEELIIYANEPTESQVMAMTPKKGEKLDQQIKRSLAIMKKNVTGTNVMDGDKPAEVGKVLEMLETKGVTTMEMLNQWQEGLPLASRSGRS